MLSEALLKYRQGLVSMGRCSADRAGLAQRFPSRWCQFLSDRLLGKRECTSWCIAAPSWTPVSTFELHIFFSSALSASRRRAAAAAFIAASSEFLIKLGA